MEARPWRSPERPSRTADRRRIATDRMDRRPIADGSATDRQSPLGVSLLMATQPTTTTGPTLRRERQLAVYQRALKTLPGGTNSNFRAWGEDTVYIDRGKGGRIWDQDQNEYIDLRMGYGPVILGHADERVDDYVNQEMRKGVSFSLTSEDEVRAMELVAEITGWVDMARMTVSGTEATMHAMRLARAYTGRNKIVKFEGQYHGVHDYALISVTPDDMSELGDADRPVRLAWGRGIPDAGADRGVRDPPDLRRGQDGLPVREGRRRGVLRHHAGSRNLCQGDGQRLPGRGLRRSPRRDERAA